MFSGLPSKRMICGLPGVVTAGPTVTVAVAVTLPAGATAVKVYVVVVAGVTVVEPVAATLPTPLLMETLVAHGTIQVNCELWPAAIVLGVASKRTTVAEVAVALDTRVVAELDKPPVSVTVNLKTYVWPATEVNVGFTEVGVASVTAGPLSCDQ